MRVISENVYWCSAQQNIYNVYQTVTITDNALNNSILIAGKLTDIFDLMIDDTIYND